MSRIGFTLLEIMISIFIFGIIFTTIFLSYNTVYSNSGSIAVDVYAHEMAKRCLNRMIEDIQSAFVAMPPEYAPPGFDDPPDPYRFVGDDTRIDSKDFGRLRFTALAHLPLDKDTRKGIAEIVYYVQKTNDGHFVLRRADHLYPYKPFQENKNDPILCEHIHSLRFMYYDNENMPHPEWNSDTDEFRYSTPRAIGIAFELDGHGASPLRFETSIRIPVYRVRID
jgi:general secretion pathway protein J